MSTTAKNLSDTHELQIADELQALKVRKARLICVNPDALGEGCEQVVIPVTTSPLTIGRAKSNDVVLDGSGVSRKHVRLVFVETSWVVEDAGSANGVEVNKSSVEQHNLKEGDIVSLGALHYKFSLESGNGIVEDSDHQVSLFDVEKTLVVSKQDLNLDSLPKREPLPATPLPSKKRSKGWVGIIVVLAVVMLALVVGNQLLH